MRSLSPALFMDVERPLYDYLSGFYQRHGALPSVEIMRQNGFALPAANGPLSYFLERLRDRAVYSAVAGIIDQLDDAVKNRNVDLVRQLVRDIAREVNIVEGGRDIVPIHELFADVMTEALLARMNGASGVTGITLGWEPIDRATAGAQPGDVISVVARPNVGKSWTLIHMAKEAWLSGASVLFLTMEMTAPQIARRTLGAATGVNPDHIRKGQITSWAEEILYEFIQLSERFPPFHMMSGSFRKTTADLDRAVQEFEPDIVFVDASYLVGSQKQQRRDGSRWERIYDVGEEIKGIATDRNRPVVQSLQLNRDKKKGTEFDMTQIAGGDVIGQISSVVVALDYPDDPNYERTRRDMIGGKNREGSLFRYTTNFLFNPMDFSVIPEEDENSALHRLERTM